MVSIQTHIHTPFLHGLVVYDVWCPLHALHVIALILPAVSIEVAELHGFALAVLHLCNEMRSISIGIVDQCSLLVGKEAVYIACCLLTRFES